MYQEEMITIDIRPHKNDFLFTAKDKQSGAIVSSSNTIKGLAQTISVSTYFVWQCLNGKRNSKKFTFIKEVCHADPRRYKTS